MSFSSVRTGFTRVALALALVAPTVATAQAHDHDAARPASAPENPRADLATHLITLSTEFRAARDHAEGLVAMYGVAPAVSPAMREHGGVLLAGLGRDVGVVRTHLAHVRAAAHELGREEQARPELAAVDRALGQIDRDVSDFDSAARGRDSAALQARARDVVTRVDEAQAAVGRLTAALH